MSITTLIWIPLSLSMLMWPNSECKPLQERGIDSSVSIVDAMKMFVERQESKDAELMKELRILRKDVELNKEWTEQQISKLSGLIENRKPIAFYAYMSGDLWNPSRQYTLKFNVVKTNVGGGYNAKTGVFSAPRDGLYVFTWVIRMHSAEHSTELIVNNHVYGASFLRAKQGDDGSVSNTAVAFLSKGQKVYVRNHLSFAGDGRIHSNLHGRPTFSGFLLQ